MDFFFLRYCRILLGVFCLMSVGHSCAQLAPAPGSAQDQTYTLHGTVTNSVTGEPIARVLVTVIAERKPAVLTGADGSFQFSGLPAGMVEVAATKPGFFDSKGSQPRAGSYFRFTAVRNFQSANGDVTVQVGPDTAPLTLKLVPEGIITGHVEDARGEPIEGALISIQSIHIVDGRKQWDHQPGHSTNEDGNFRIANLSPGRYYVSVLAAKRRGTLEDLTQTAQTGYPLVVYYPSASDRTSAAPIEVKAGQRVELQFALKLQSVFKVSGAVSGRDNDQFVQLKLLSLSGDELSVPARFDSASGKFEIERVPAGTYRLEARGSGYSDLVLNVAGNLNDVHLQLNPKMPIPISVRTEFTGTNTPPIPQMNGEVPVYILLRKTGYDQGPVVAGMEKGSDGSHVVNAPPGRYYADLQPLNGSYVQAAHYGDIDLLKDELIVSPGTMPRPIEVVLRDDSATLTVKIPSADSNASSTVLMLPQAPPGQLRIIHIYGNTEAGVPGLAPGDYKLFAFDSVEQIEFRNPEVLDQYSSKSVQVMLTARGKANATLELVHTEEQ